MTLSIPIHTYIVCMSVVHGWEDGTVALLYLCLVCCVHWCRLWQAYKGSRDVSATTTVYRWEYSDIQDKFYYSAHVDPAVSVCVCVCVCTCMCMWCACIVCTCMCVLCETGSVKCSHLLWPTDGSFHFYTAVQVCTGNGSVQPFSARLCVIE